MRKTFFYCLVFLAIYSCSISNISQSKYKLESVVKMETSNLESDQVEETKKIIIERLNKAGFVNVEIKENLKEFQLIIITKLMENNEKTLALHRSLLNTFTLGFWDTFQFDDEYVKNISKDLPNIPSFLPNEFLGRNVSSKHVGFKETLGSTYNQDSLIIIKNILEKELVDYPRLKLFCSVAPLEMIEEDGSIVKLHHIYMMDVGVKNKIRLNNKHLSEAKTELDPYYDMPIINLKMNEEGAKLFYDLTYQATIDGGRSIGIILNDLVYSVPAVRNGPISGGAISISGGFTIEEANHLATALNNSIGYPYPLTLIKENFNSKNIN